MTWPFADRWDGAMTFDAFVAAADDRHRGLWEAIHRLARVPPWAARNSATRIGRLRLVVLSEDWCGDAVNTVPFLAKWAEATGHELRILRRDEHPDVMDRYLTGESARAIPVVVVLNERMEELGWWGPRPRDLQAFVRDQIAAGRPKPEIYPETRRWYARDKGATTLREVMAIVARSANEAAAEAT